MTPHVLGEIRRWRGPGPKPSRRKHGASSAGIWAWRWQTPVTALDVLGAICGIIILTMTARSSRRDAKADALRAHGALHPRPQAVQAPLFASHDFFDPRDLVQVKYEMLRQVDVEGAPVARTADAFGVSRPTFYQTQTAFKQRGHRRPGPSETRAARRPQARRRGDGLCGVAARRRTRRSVSGRCCPGFTTALGSTCTCGASSAPCDARKKNAAERSRRRPLGGAGDRHAGGELRNVATAGAGAAWSPRRAEPRIGDPAPPGRGGLAPRVGDVSTSLRSGGPLRHRRSRSRPSSTRSSRSSGPTWRSHIRRPHGSNG